MNIVLTTTIEPQHLEMFLEADPSEEIVQNYLNHGRVYLLMNDQEVMGGYVLIETRPHTMELVNVVVKDDHKRKGYGKQLVFHAIETAKGHGVLTLELGTGNSSIMQLKLYQKCGFRMVSIVPDFFTRHYEEPIYEEGLLCRDMIRLAIHFK